MSLEQILVSNGYQFQSSRFEFYDEDFDHHVKSVPCRLTYLVGRNSESEKCIENVHFFGVFGCCWMFAVNFRDMYNQVLSDSWNILMLVKLRILDYANSC